MLVEVESRMSPPTGREIASHVAGPPPTDSPNGTILSAAVRSRNHAYAALASSAEAMLGGRALARAVTAIVDREDVGAQAREELETIVAGREASGAAVEVEQRRQRGIAGVIASVDAHAIFSAQPNVRPRPFHHRTSVVPADQHLFPKHQHDGRAHISDDQRNAQPTRDPAPGGVFGFR